MQKIAYEMGKPQTVLLFIQVVFFRKTIQVLQ